MALFSYHSRLSDPPTAYARHSTRRTDQGGLRDIEPLADLLSRDLFVSHQGLKLGHVFFIDRPDPTTFSYGPKASHRSLMGELSLELGQSPKDVKSKPALGGRRVGPSVKEAKSTAFSSRRSILKTRSFKEHPNRSRRQTTSVSPSRRLSEHFSAQAAPEDEEDVGL